MVKKKKKENYTQIDPILYSVDIYSQANVIIHKLCNHNLTCTQLSRKEFTDCAYLVYTGLNIHIHVHEYMKLHAIM